jgi:hypothetical protein
MKEIYTEVQKLVKEKKIVIPVCLVMFLSYAYLWTHPSMGVDDTAMTRYFVDGFAPHLGRWTIFLLGKIFHMIEFTPVVTDFLGVVFMSLSAAVMFAGFQRSAEKKISNVAGTVFICFLISYPLINEVYVYYLHNGLGLAYLLTAVTYYLLRFETGWKKQIAAVLFLTLALGCYETFAEVILLLFFADTLIRIAFSESKLSWKVWLKLFSNICIVIIVSMVVRSLVNNLILYIIQVEPYVHSIGKSIKWIFSAEFLETVKGMVRGFGRYYVLNATVNYGIGMFWLAMVILTIFGILQSIRRKSWLCILNIVGILGISWVISMIEGNIGAYRTMQTFPILVGMSMMLLCCFLQNVVQRTFVRRLGFVLLLVLLYNQVYETNKWYYVDYLKYQEEVTICRELAYDIQKYATMDKPIIFIGRITEYGTADTYMYVKPGSWQYRLFAKLDGTEETEKKYEIVQNPAWYSVFDWGTDAFDEHATELKNFFAYHGYTIQVASRAEKVLVADLAAEMPIWPKEGSIIETDQYVVVKLGEVQELEYHQ